MGYRPDEQSLSEPLGHMLKGIEIGYNDFCKAIQERIKSQEWKDDHLEELCKLQLDLAGIQIRMLKIQSENW